MTTGPTDGGEHFDQDVEDARNTRCPKCDAAYEVVRPGKIQPSCPCDYIARLNDDLDGTRAALDHANARLAAAEKERDAEKSEHHKTTCSLYESNLCMSDLIGERQELRGSLVAAIARAETSERELAEMRTSPAYGDKFVREQLDSERRRAEEAERTIAEYARQSDDDDAAFIGMTRMRDAALAKLTIAVKALGRIVERGEGKSHTVARAALDAMREGEK